MVTFTSHDDPERMPAFPDSPPILPALPPFPESAEVPPFPDSPLISPIPNSVSMPPFPESSTILTSASSPCPMFWELDLNDDTALPNFPGLASDPNSTFPSFPMPDPNQFGVPNYWDHDNISMPAFPTVPPFPESAIKALPKASKSKKKGVRRSPTDGRPPCKRQKKGVPPQPSPQKGPIGHEVDPTNFKPIFPELQNTHEEIRSPNASSIPYGVGYAAALKAAEDHLDRIEFIEDQVFITGYTLERIQSNIQGWLISWDQ
ncbi:hypothetical protein BYT27DRAFT_7206964 [Phlegmacium glaucopus]|nr:hypothetical protein BYT27DRAFT_7206964 [Phlegmacium glaucopus]